MKRKKKFGEKLGAIESLFENAHAHYVRVEEAIGHASVAEVQAHYAYLHGVMLEDVVADPRFPWHPQYKYGDAKKCCENCQELEMAIAVNLVNAGEGHPLAASLPDLGKLASEAAIAGYAHLFENPVNNTDDAHHGLAQSYRAMGLTAGEFADLRSKP